ncbi:LysR family transcriptional regulator [Xenorhabdus sp. KJ12.1]|uniref:LysR family transcriptional regulator n=1 Tax=Xenorhabdus sp. KJ12.1 TaxID=1851571 RepID=UPI000C0561D7|nr:LysR family transcriptional regulator [Xenorhabdus sp. KJ12.1]PHM68599.1 LysR family transcriptional regulator [Xenorhabdus sp. KJ12.1]
MQRRLPPLGTLRAFDAVARLKSFKLAAEELNVSPTAISHQIRLLEEQLAICVLKRSPRYVALTEEGKILQKATSQVFLLLQSAINEMRLLHSSSPFTLTTTTAFITCWLIPHLAEIRHQFPDIDLRLHADDCPVDLDATGIDMAIRYGYPPRDTLNIHIILEDEFVLAASPTFKIKSLEDLHNVPLIHTDGRRIPQPSPDWDIWRSCFGPKQLEIVHGARFTDETHSIQAAIAGEGAIITK